VIAVIMRFPYNATMNDSFWATSTYLHLHRITLEPSVKILTLVIR